MISVDETVLALCPANMTVGWDGPNGKLGDRIHQLPAVRYLMRVCKRVLVWPLDAVTRDLYADMNVTLLEESVVTDVVGRCRQEGVNRIVGLHGGLPDSNISIQRAVDAGGVQQCLDIVAGFYNGKRVVHPHPLDPRGHFPLWQALLGFSGEQIGIPLEAGDRKLPFATANEIGTTWAQTVARADDDATNANSPFVIVSPLSAGGLPVEEKAYTPWWSELIERLGQAGWNVICPVLDHEVADAQALLGDHPHVTVNAADLAQTVALGSLTYSVVVGIDGGRLNLLAASRAEPVIGLYGKWPASAWALPNVGVLQWGSAVNEVMELVTATSQDV